MKSRRVPLWLLIVAALITAGAFFATKPAHVPPPQGSVDGRTASIYMLARQPEELFERQLVTFACAAAGCVLAALAAAMAMALQSSFPPFRTCAEAVARSLAWATIITAGLGFLTRFTPQPLPVQVAAVTASVILALYLSTKMVVSDGRSKRSRANRWPDRDVPTMSTVMSVAILLVVNSLCGLIAAAGYATNLPSGVRLLLQIFGMSRTEPFPDSFFAGGPILFLILVPIVVVLLPLRTWMTLWARGGLSYWRRRSSLFVVVGLVGIPIFYVLMMLLWLVFSCFVAGLAFNLLHAPFPFLWVNAVLAAVVLIEYLFARATMIEFGT